MVNRTDVIYCFDRRCRIDQWYKKKSKGEKWNES